MMLNNCSMPAKRRGIPPFFHHIFSNVHCVNKAGRDFLGEKRAGRVGVCQAGKIKRSRNDCIWPVILPRYIGEPRIMASDPSTFLKIGSSESFTAQ